MAQFIGRYEHTLDAKGRLILPVRFRPPFERGGYLSQYHEGCLALWTPEEFERQLQSRQSEAERGREERNLVRVWAGGSSEVEMDKSGRMPVPGYLRAFAGLEPPTGREPAPAPVLVIGAIDRVELWSPVAWEAKVAPSERALMDA